MLVFATPPWLSVQARARQVAVVWASASSDNAGFYTIVPQSATSTWKELNKTVIDSMLLSQFS